MVVLCLLLGLEIGVAIVEFFFANDAHLAPPLEHLLLLQLVLQLFFVHLLLCSSLFELVLGLSLLRLALIPLVLALLEQLVLQALFAPLEVDFLLLVEVVELNLTAPPLFVLPVEHGAQRLLDVQLVLLGLSCEVQVAGGLVASRDLFVVACRPVLDEPVKAVV